MAKNTKIVKVSKHWFESRNHGKSAIFATRIKVEEPKVSEVKPLKNMEVVRMILEKEGRIDLESAVEKFLEAHTLATDNPKPRARAIFLQANKYVKALGHPAGVKIEKVDKNTYIQLA